jgi:hypothetical protein
MILGRPISISRDVAYEMGPESLTEKETAISRALNY